MGFRTIVVKDRSKLDLKLNYLVCRNDKETRVFIPEISTLILESTAIAVTTALISELVKNNVKIIFCDEKHNPESELLPYYASYNSSKKIKQQIAWLDQTKSAVWTEIIRNKVYQQSKFLCELGHSREVELLYKYIDEIKCNDSTNREGHASKVYFNAIFGLDFVRRDMNIVNNWLNYGYAIILSCFNREIVKNGYLTQLGIWHKNEFNDFNLASDLMEPFRVLVDRVCIKLTPEDNYKLKLLELFDLQVTIDGKKQYLENAISIYCQSVFDALQNNQVSSLKFYEL